MFPFLKDTKFNIDIYKFVITSPNNLVSEIKPYIAISKMKLIKDYFNHGEIVYTGINYYIFKIITNTKKVWKELLFDDYNKIMIPFEFLQSNSYSYYLNTIKNDTLSMLPLDNEYNIFLDHEIDFIHPEPFNTYDRIEFSNNDENNENENENIDNGIMKYENDIFYIKNNDNWNDILDKFIPHDYIIYKGYLII